MRLAEKNEKFDFQDWLIRRKRTTRFFYFQSLTLGAEYAVTMMTLYLYLTDILKLKSAEGFYTAISTVYIVSRISCSLFFGHLFDRYRDLKLMLFIGNVLVIIGNTLYTIPLSPWFLFTGRLISGGGGCLRAIMTSELIRSYPEEELLPHFTSMGISFALGFILGPVINFPFVNADFRFLGIHITYANGAGLVLVLTFILVQIIATFAVSDLSKEYDLKEMRMHENAEIQLVVEGMEEISLSDGEDTERPKKRQTDPSTTIKHLMNSLDLVLVLFFSMFLMHCMTVYDLWEPMACVQFQHWGIFEINVLNLGYGLMAAVIFVLLIRKPPLNESLVYLAMVCIFCLAACQMIYIVFKLMRPNNMVSIFLWTILTCCFSISILMEEIFLINAMARLVPSNVQAFCESVRLSSSRIGSALGLLTAAYSFDYLQYVCVGYLATSLVVMLLLIWRKKQFQYPKVIKML